MNNNNLFDPETSPSQAQEKKPATSKSTIGKEEKIILDFLRKTQPHEVETIRVLADYANSAKITVTLAAITIYSNIETWHYAPLESVINWLFWPFIIVISLINFLLIICVMHE